MAVTQVMSDEPIANEEQPAEVVEETTDGVQDSPEATDSPEGATPEPTPDDGAEEDVFTPVEAPEVKENLVELPDGRKVTPSQAVDAYKDLQKDYTKKAQELSELKKTGAPKPWDDPNWTPKTDAEAFAAVSEHTAQDVLKLIQQSQDAEARQKQEVQGKIDAELAAIRDVDADFDEESVFKFANENGIKSLVTAYNLKKQIEYAEKRGEKRALKNVKARSEEPVSGAAGSTDTSGGMDFPEDMSLHEKVRHHLRSMNN